jgi:polyisoprenoid-binding protein YceI
MFKTLIALSTVVATGAVLAAPETYQIDPQHTYPSFEADHMGGKSVWRGKIKRSSGTITLDRVTKNGTVDVTMDMASIDVGLDALDKDLRSAAYLDVEKYPTAIYKGRLSDWKGELPTAVDGELTLHGITKPLKLAIKSLMCKPNPMLKVDSCGADAAASFNRDDFGLDGGKSFGFLMFVRLAIQVEANKIGAAKP